MPSSAKPVPLSRGEMEIMEVIWNRGEAAALEVRDVIRARRNVSRTTVRTMLARMETKGWLKHRVIGQTFFYSAIVERDATLGQRLLEIVDRLCGGRAERLVNALIAHRGLSSDEVERIRAMLDVTGEESERKAHY